MVDNDEYTFHDIEINGELQSLYDSMITVLRREIDVYQEMCALFLCEREILVRSDAEELHENNSRKETCVLKAKMLNEVRIKLVEKIANVFGVEEQEITVSTLISHGNSRQKRELLECRSTLHALVQNAHELNERNKLLLDSSIMYVRKSIEFINQLLSPPSTYLNNGELRNHSMHGKIVCKEG
ncbi:MAG: flagellar protein FlgN [Deltaproteobacteria bacterium]|nr:flagellar protein FlgN [Deltaproteobacteria bacterium]